MTERMKRNWEFDALRKIKTKCLLTTAGVQAREGGLGTVSCWLAPHPFLNITKMSSQV